MGLSKEDWERVKQVSQGTIKEAEVNLEVNKKLLQVAEKELKKFPEDEEKRKTPVGV